MRCRIWIWSCLFQLFILNTYAQSPEERLAKYIINREARNFQFPADSFWRDYQVRPELIQIITHPNISDSVKLVVDRLISARLHGINYYSVKAKQSLAHMYVKAIALACNNPTQSIIDTNIVRYGEPGTPNYRLIQIGEIAIPALLSLLENRCIFNTYANDLFAAHKLRVRDQAALLIARIKNIPLTLNKYKSPVKRDRLIENLKKRVLQEPYTIPTKDLLIDFIKKKGLKQHLPSKVKDSLWSHHRTELIEIITTPNIDDRIKLRVDWILFYRQRDLSIFNLATKKALARLYAKALRKSCYAPDWFYYSNAFWAYITFNELGRMPGHRIMQLGDLIVPELALLLDDNCFKFGRRDRRYYLRIKDFAAFFIARIKKISLPLHKHITPQKRDELIENLKKELDK
ncbi:hypothetical protein BKI52_25135 [marine bacterium AO1-C]|nr:hypothetical protein BKI52_25135 [marine bacterium AO1-C]